ncbi:ABC transporter permease [Rhizobium pusense]|uniref:ABC transporter permease n=1 Tax=Agrobacterium pusense TaxID=648995 RepID=UPI002449EF88|nr:ABC transporter permease [Agrobacterium pusense]MDH2091394.1 ABC transporter permease [Agrobacterium pusense]
MLDKNRRTSIGTAVFAHGVITFLIVPTLMVVPISFNGNQYLKFPPEAISLRWYRDFWSNPDWLQSTWNSLLIACAVTVLATVLGTLAAIGLSRSRGVAKGLVMGLVVSPMIIPTVSMALALYFFFAKFHLVGTWTAVVLGQTVLALPFTVLNVYGSLQSYPITLERAASTLGAGPLTTFFRITMPIIRPGIAAGALFAFLASFDEFIIALFLAGPGMTTLPVHMWNTMQLYISPTIAAVSTMITGITILLFLFGILSTRLGARR